jgi:glycosyltransferase involved in cell wall biosynthesis
MKASLIIPTYNKIARLKLVLTSLNIQDEPFSNFEVIIVDDGSEDDTNDYIHNLNVKWNKKVISQHNSGRAAARNRGIAVSKNEILIFCDDDTILHSEFISQHIKAQNAKIGVVHGKIINLEGLRYFSNPATGDFYDANLDVKKYNYLTRYIITENDLYNNFEGKILPLGRITMLEKAIKIVIDSKATNANWIGSTGGNFSVPKLWANKVGGFDESFGRRWGCEDFEFGYRLCQQGYNIVYNSEAINYHMAHKRENIYELILMSFSEFYKKHEDSSIYVVRDYLLNKIEIKELLNLLKNEVWCCDKRNISNLKNGS